MDGWNARVPIYVAQVAAIRKQLCVTFPSEQDGSPYSRS
eukprot:COSAG02_NODE_64234_length_261_cov_0.629630_1_plen_38_part_01